MTAETIPKSTLLRRLQSSPSARSAITHGGNFIFAAFGALFLSRLLQKLSGEALWEPSEWRQSIEVVTTLLGPTVFALVSYRSHPRPPRKIVGPESAEPPREDERQAAEEREEKSREARNRAKSIVCIAIFCLFLLGYMTLRSRCMFGWDPRDWVDEQKKQGELDPPYFLDTKAGLIYIPIWFTPDEQSYLDRIAQAHPGEDGLSHVLETEPDRVIIWLQGACRMRLENTSALFFVLHLSMIVAIAAATAYAFDPADALIDMLGGHK